MARARTPFLNLLFNIFWAIFCGIEMTLTCVCLGICSVITIIPIFFGVPKVYFRIIPLVFAPAGKSVKLHFGSAPIRNIIYLIFGGFVEAIFGLLLSLALCCTIIGIPLGLQLFKISKYFFAPFGADVI